MRDTLTFQKSIFPEQWFISAFTHNAVFCWRLWISKSSRIRNKQSQAPNQTPEASGHCKGDHPACDPNNPKASFGGPGGKRRSCMSQSLRPLLSEAVLPTSLRLLNRLQTWMQVACTILSTQQTLQFYKFSNCSPLPKLFIYCVREVNGPKCAQF